MIFLFDLDDTLYEQIEPFKIAYNEVFYDIKNIDIDKLFKETRKISDETFHLTVNGSMDEKSMHIYRIVESFKRFNIHVSDEDALNFQNIYKESQYKISLDPNIKEVLELLKINNIPMGIITNGPTIHQKKKLESIGISNYIKKENIIISGSLNVIKPQRQIFSIALNTFNVDLEKENPDLLKDIYYVGDSFQNDVVGAVNANITPIFINKKNFKLPHDYAKKTLEINSSKELLPLIKSLIERIG